MNRCWHCRHGDHDACWGVSCGCLVCIADDHDEFVPWREAA